MCFNQTHADKEHSPEAFAYSVSEKGLPDGLYRYLNSFNVNLHLGCKICERSSLPGSET